MDKAAIRINLLLRVIYTNFRFYIDWIDLQITALLGPHLIRRPTPIRSSRLAAPLRLAQQPI
jgi:hypothetical protein